MGLAEYINEIVIGHRAQAEALARIYRNQRFPHGLLLSGPSGIGKRLFGWRLAQFLLCDRTGGPANEFRMAQAGQHPDFHLLRRNDDRKSLSVEDVRDFIQKIRLAPYYGHAVVGVIENAEEMSRAAADALLMTLEEPLANRYLILVSDAPQLLPDTIISRVQVVNFQELNAEELKLLLRKLLEPLDSAAKLLPSLEEMSKGSLANLELSSSVDLNSLSLELTDDLTEHLESVISDFKAVRKVLEAIKTSGPESLVDLVSFGSRVGAVKSGPNRILRLLQWELRQEMRQASSLEIESAHRLAKLLSGLIETEQACSKRNANAGLQVTSLLLNTAK